ncbi:MAG: hypothetical protein R8G34_14860 [Paracoccaceae bacterium]|nr:hypothetical protein [Paracoccaceae bacterium]
MFFWWVPLAGFAAGPDAADTPSGLMWNRTGLPAVFPLQVKTPVGQNYLLTLTDAKTGDGALAAFIEGGAFFKVLVPPGTYDVHFAHGDTWISEEELFGAGDKTQNFEIAEPLTFAIRDFSTKAGHLIDVAFSGPTEGAQITVTAQYLCQGMRLTAIPRLQPSFDDVDSFRYRIPDEGELMRFPSRFSEERLLDSGDEPTFPTRYAPYFSQPEYEVRASLC